MERCTCYDEGLLDQETGLPLVAPLPEGGEQRCDYCVEHGKRSAQRIAKLDKYYAVVKSEHPGWAHKPVWVEVKNRIKEDEAK